MRPRLPSNTFGLLIAAVATVISACAPSPEPDLVRIHAEAAERQKPPLIVIPGLIGSRLVDPDTGEEVWPGSLLGLILGVGDRFQALVPLPSTEPDLVPRGFFHEELGEDYYGRLIQTLTRAGGYDCIPAAEATETADCLLMAWDWRQDLVQAAGRLEGLIERLRELRGEPSLQVDLLGHSAGGLVIRYFIRFGGRDILAGSGAQDPGYGRGMVNRAVLLGVPNFGSISGLQEMLRGHRIGNAFVEPEIMATVPSLFQMLPHPDRSWMVDIEGNRLERDLYDPAIWRRYRWSIYSPDARKRIESGAVRGLSFSEIEARFLESLSRAEAFHRALSTPIEQSPLRYVVFGGDCIMTPALCLLERVDGEPKVRLHPDEVVNKLPDVDYERLMLEPGDGKVTRTSLLAWDRLKPDASASFPIDQVVFLCEPHAQLPSSLAFEDNLLNQLLYPWVP